MASLLEVDLLVIGGGMAGMTAAGRVASEGRSVIVVEKGDEIGGSAALSGGRLWCAPRLDVLIAETPGGDPELGEVVFRGYGDAVEWVRSLGVWISEEESVLDFGRGYQFDVVDYLQRCRALVESAGGHVVVNASVESLLVKGGRVEGARVSDRDGRAELSSAWTLLATGGFQGDPRLRALHIHPQAASMLLRANPNSAGDGLRLGCEAGGTTSGAMDGFYGHLMCAPVDHYPPGQFGPLAQGHSTRGVLLNWEGERFADESLGDHVNAQRVISQPQARAVLLIDEVVRREHGAVSLEGSEDKLDLASAYGARLASADTWARLSESVAGWGLDRDRVLRSIDEYNRGVSGGLLEPSRSRYARPLDRPPFYAMEVRSGITATHGGLKIDRRARVVDGNAEPVPGLLAAGADAGGVYGNGYAGGLALASVFGLAAAGVVVG